MMHNPPPTGLPQLTQGQTGVAPQQTQNAPPTQGNTNNAQSNFRVMGSTQTQVVKRYTDPSPGKLDVESSETNIFEELASNLEGPSIKTIELLR